MSTPDYGVTESWMVVWFPPSGDKRKRFMTEKQARSFAAEDQVVEWNPLLEHHLVITTIELVPLEHPEGTTTL